jgi:hypothetical protein
MLSTEQLTAARERYTRAMEEVEQIALDAICDTLKAITCKEPDDRLRDKLADAIRYNL